MKKAYIAIYAGLFLFFAVFIGSALLDSNGYQHQSRIGFACCVILFACVWLVGLYSNVTNYGYFWSGVKNFDLNLPFEQLDKKYLRIQKGTFRYRVGIGIAALFGAAACIFGVILVLKELVR